MSRARTLEEIQPLVELCRKGKLFEVQEWIASGGPVGRPEAANPKCSKQNPLRIAMELGFHSMVKVLLEAGAPWLEGSYNALFHAVSMRRPDLAELLLDHGADISSVPMVHVLYEYLPEAMELFIARGGDMETDYPLARAFIFKVRPALGIYKRHCQRFPSFKSQLDLALRHHAYEGDAKWVSLLLWAGGDPLAPGCWNLDDLHDDPEYFSTALELAATGGHLDVLKLKPMAALCKSGLQHSGKLLEAACGSSNSALFDFLFERGLRPEILPDGGTTAISHLVMRMSWCYPTDILGYLNDRRPIDTQEARDCMKSVHMLVARGARWLPTDKAKLKDIRRCLLKLTTDYTLELVWILGKYGAARRQDVKDLVMPTSMQRHLGDRMKELHELVGRVAAEVGSQAPPNRVD